MDAFAKRPVARARSKTDVQLHGRQLGDFVLQERIGEGAFAAVYRCEQSLLGRKAVIKVLHQRLRTSEGALQRFMREARLASRLSHPYAAHVYAFGVEPEDGLAWIAMEMVHGTSLEHRLRDSGPMPLDVLVPFFEHVAEVVHDAHEHSIVHRDLKPSNVMLIDYAGRLIPKLLDFGIAKLVDDAAPLEMPGIAVELDAETRFALEDTGSQSLTQANSTLGSPPYMSPEQWCDPLSVGPRSDLYSLAVMTYEALTGVQPFTGATIAAIGERHCNGEVPPVGDRFPAALDRVFQRALAKLPADRPASALAFVRELRAAAFPVQEAERSGARSIPFTAPPAPPALPAKRRVWPLAGGAAALVVGGLAVYTVLVGGKPDRTLAQPAVVLAHPVEVALPPSGAGGVMPAGPAPAVTAPPADTHETVPVEIMSTPPGAEVFWLVSETRFGTTPLRQDLPSKVGVAVFVLKKPGFADQRVEIDLRTGGKRSVKLPRLIRRPAAAPGQVPVRRKGEPVDPFRTPGTP